MKVSLHNHNSIVSEFVLISGVNLLCQSYDYIKNKYISKCHIIIKQTVGSWEGNLSSLGEKNCFYPLLVYS